MSASQCGWDFSQLVRRRLSLAGWLCLAAQLVPKANALASCWLRLVDGEVMLIHFLVA